MLGGIFDASCLFLNGFQFERVGDDIFAITPLKLKAKNSVHCLVFVLE